MRVVKPAFQPVNICFSANDDYAPYCAVAIGSLLEHADRNRYYDIIIMHQGIQEASQQLLTELQQEREYVSIRTVDVADYASGVQSKLGVGYLTQEANFKLLLFSELFEQYDKMLFLDCDIIVQKDICQFYDIPLDGKCLGAVESVVDRYKAYTKRAVFCDNVPYSMERYKKEVLQLTYPDNYFYPTGLLFDLKKARTITDEKKAGDMIRRHRYHANEKEVLNMLFNEQVKLVDIEWNYVNVIPQLLQDRREEVREMFREYERTCPGIIHYVGPKKPWNATVPLGEIWKNYASKYLND